MTILNYSQPQLLNKDNSRPRALAFQCHFNFNTCRECVLGAGGARTLVRSGLAESNENPFPQGKTVTCS